MTPPAQRRPRWSSVLLLVAVFCGTTAGESAERVGPPAILLLYGEARPIVAVLDLDEGIRSTFQSRWSGEVQFYTEFLDLSWFQRESYQQTLRDFLARKYAGRRIDVIMPAGGTALRFILAHRGELFPGVPIVFASLDRATAVGLDIGPGITGSWMVPDWEGTLEAIRRLQPDVRRTVIITGTSDLDRAWQADAKKVLGTTYANHIEIVHLTDRTARQVVEDVRALPPHTAVLWVSMLRDGAGAAVNTTSVLSAVSAASSVPVYGMSETGIGRGSVGGRVVDFGAQGRAAAELAIRIVAGENPRDVTTTTAASRYVFDWGQLRRWRLADDRLPEGSVVRNRPLSVWNLYGAYIVAGLGLVVVQATLIAGLLVQRDRRRRAQLELVQGLRFERFVSDLSAALASRPPAEVDQAIKHGLRDVAGALDADRAVLVEFTERLERTRLTYGWLGSTPVPDPATMRELRFPWLIGRLREGEIVSVARLDALPPEAATDRASYETLGITSVLVVPLQVARSVFGGLSISTLGRERVWPDDLVQRLHLVAGIFANAVARRQAATTLRETEDRFRLMADSAPVMVWVTDTGGRCTYLNRSWLDFTGRHLREDLQDGWRGGVHPDDRAECLASYRKACDARRDFTIEYRLRRFDGTYRSILDHGVPRLVPDGAFQGFIGSAIDVTERQQAEATVRRQRDELAHALRVTAMGELAASLAHEINQPLFAILGNAEAARRLLAAPALDVSELRETVGDISEDGKRASEVIRRLRTFFATGESQHTVVDMNELVTELAGLVRREVEQRGISLTLARTGGLPRVLGDPVQLQQVLLNLILNGCDAMEGISSPRQLTIRTSKPDAETLEIAVQDGGVGVKAENLERIFQPFVTSKSSGLGMGLSISRSIVESHGGRIWMTPNVGRGVTVHVVLPCQAPRS